MKTLKVDSLYVIPHYMPLRDYQQKDDQHILDLGGEETFKRLCLDHTSLEVLKKFLSPYSPLRAAQEMGALGEDVIRFCSYLYEEGLLIEYKKIPDQYQRYDRHLNYYALNGLDSVKAQEVLKEVSVALVGMGGIGNWVGTRCANF